MPVTVPPPSPIPPVPATTPLPESGASSGVSWPWLKWFEILRQRLNSGTGINSINGDTTPDQVVQGAGGVTVSTSGGVTTVDSSAATAGLVSINADTTHDQLILAGANVTITDMGGGRHTISAAASAGTAGIVAINTDTTPNQTITGTGGITVSTATGITTVDGSGIADIEEVIALTENDPPTVLVNFGAVSYDDIVFCNGTGGGGGGGGFTAGGDLSGGSSSQTVIGLEGKPLDATTVATPSDGQVITYVAAAGKYKAVTPSSVGGVSLTIDGGASSPTIGSKGFAQVPYNGTIIGWTLVADASGSAQITVKKSTYAAFPTTASIVAAAPPLLSSAQKNTNTTLTGWTTTITAGDMLEFNLDSVTTCIRLMLELQIQKS